MKKILAVFVCCLLLLSTLLSVGCVTTPRTYDDTVPDSLELDKDYACELQLAYRNDPAEKELIDRIIEGFNAIYKNIKIKTVPLSNYETQIIGDFAANNLYDVFWVADNSASSFAAEGMLLDLRPYVEKSEMNLEDYYPTMIDLCYRDHDPEKELIMLPRDFSNMVVFINEDRFADAGVPVPTDYDWTWDDMMDIVEQLTKGLKQYNADNDTLYWALDANFEWTILFYSLLKSFGGEDATLLDENCYSAWGNEEEPGPSYQAAYDTLTELKKLFDMEALPRPLKNLNGTMFETNKAAMFFMSRPHLTTIRTLPMHLSVLPFPLTGSNPSTGSGTTGYGISRGTKEKAASWALLEYMMSREGQEVFSQSGGVVPVLKELAEDPNAEWRKVTDYYGKIVDPEAFLYNADHAIVNDYYDHVPADYQMGINGIFCSAVNAVYNGDLSVEAAIKSFTTNIKKAVIW